jgi:hypothetical protein
MLLITQQRYTVSLIKDHAKTLLQTITRYPKHEQRVFHQIQKTRAQLECFISDKACFPQANFFARSDFFIVKIEKHLLKIQLVPAENL